MRARFPKYVPVTERRKKASSAAAKLAKKGKAVTPIVITGRTIATTFWGKSWCENLERYHDYESRLPRGRTYVRNGSVIDLKIDVLEVKATVSGSSLYKVVVKTKPLSKVAWRAICKACIGEIDSLVELLQGTFSQAIMERICRKDGGFFPKPSEIMFSCSCPDFASMCKHIAAALYGVGSRLDTQPELLFRLRGVDEQDLIAALETSGPVLKKDSASGNVVVDQDISELFGLEIDTVEPATISEKRPSRRNSATATSLSLTKKAPTPNKKKTPTKNASKRPAKKRLQ